MRLRLFLLLTLFISASSYGQTGWPAAYHQIQQQRSAQFMRNAFCGQVADYKYVESARKGLSAEIFFTGEAVGYWVDATTHDPNGTYAKSLTFTGKKGNSVHRSGFISFGVRVRRAKTAGQRVCIAFPASQGVPLGNSILITDVRVASGADDLSILLKIAGQL